MNMGMNMSMNMGMNMGMTDGSGKTEGMSMSDGSDRRVLRSLGMNGDVSS
jgi:hypothetical protein